MNCPGCGEINESGMQFCINCGHILSAPPPPTPVAALPSISVPVDDYQARASGQNMVLLCTVCKKTDPLNGQFCVYCGGRTAPAPAPVGSNANFGASSLSFTGAQSLAVNIPPNSPSVQYESQRMSGEQTHIQGSTSSKPKPASPALAIVLGVLLGVAAAAAGVYLMSDEVQAAALKSQWPKQGLLLYSRANNGDLTIVDNGHKFLILGKTSTDGTIQYPELASGSYKLLLADKDGKRLEEGLTVKDGEANIIGYPNRLEPK